MFVIEYAVAQGPANPSVVYRVNTRTYTLGLAEQVAQGTLASVRRMFPESPPDSFQILDDNDEVILQSWVSALLKPYRVGSAVLSKKIAAGKKRTDGALTFRPSLLLSRQSTKGGDETKPIGV
jgi:hypothetical protein